MRRKEKRSEQGQTRQSNTTHPRQSAASDGTRTHDTLHSRQSAPCIYNMHVNERWRRKEERSKQGHVYVYILVECAVFVLGLRIGNVGIWQCGMLWANISLS